MISIIVPVYNVENVLIRCLESLIKQTVRNFEIILIDDGSTDRSGLICDCYSSKYKNINVIHTTNCGVSKARNKGIEVAHGDYIVFCDSDDYVDELYLEKLQINDCDLSIGSCMFCDSKGSPISIARQEKNIIQEFNKFNFIQWFKQGSLYSVWGCMFRKSIIDQYNLKFDFHTKRGEDTLFMLDYIVHCKRVKFVSQVLYYYVRYNSNTLTTTLNIQNIDSLSYLDEKLKDWFQKKNIVIKEFDNPNYWTKREIKEQFLYIMSNPNIIVKEKLNYYRIFCHNITFQKYKYLFFKEEHKKFKFILKMNCPFIWIIFDLYWMRRK